MTAAKPPLRRRRTSASAQTIVEERAVGQAGEAVVEGLVAQLLEQRGNTLVALG